VNLIEDRWIPARRRSGRVERIAPWEITDGFTDDPFVRLAAPRPDFNGALVQFLIGLLQTCFAPGGRPQWRQRLQTPPQNEELKEAFLTVKPAFQLDGDGPRFLQDLTLQNEIAALDPAAQQERTKPIGDLLVEVPTGKTLRDNTDLFVKRSRVLTMCPACAAAALFALQTNAPSGGQGHRTGIRGGGPLTTLIKADSLWETCWLAVLEQDAFMAVTGNPSKDSLADRLPWLAPTRTSEGGRVTTPEDTNTAQVFWAMPRRVRLVFAEATETCNLCSGEASPVVKHFLTKNLGVNYTGPWKHPLSPYYLGKDGDPSPVHPQDGGIGYRHWLGLVHGVGDEKGAREPATVVGRYLRHGAEDLRLWAFGWDMDNMKARCWYESTMPLVLCSPDTREEFAFHVALLLRGAEVAAFEIRGQLRKALFRPGSDPKGDLSFITARFWQESEPGFYVALHSLRRLLHVKSEVVEAITSWHRVLVRTADAIFEDVSQTGAFDSVDPKRIALAWRDLQKALHGRKMRTALGLADEAPMPADRKGRRAKNA
jgi:CRISPR system Cascade subunit CasA